MTVRSPSLLIAAQIYGHAGHASAQAKPAGSPLAQRAEREAAFNIELKAQDAGPGRRAMQPEAQPRADESATSHQSAFIQRQAAAKPRNPTLELFTPAPFTPAPLAPAKRLDEGRGRRDAAPVAAQAYTRPGSHLNIVI